MRRKIAAESAALALAVPEVVVRRMLQIWLSRNIQSPRDRAELYRMSAEKVAAFYESWTAMWLASLRANVQFAVSSMWWPWSAATSKRGPQHVYEHGQRMMAAMLGAGLAPIRRRAVANVRRLRRNRL